jgi:anthraniloyl-CoA monooxygenase
MDLVEASRSPDATAVVALVLSHAGRRGSARPRNEGVDRPLRAGGWETVAPSATAFSPRHPVPRAVAGEEFVSLADQFGAAARRAEGSGAPVLMVDMAYGYLLASFLSPVSNRREDGYGGSLANRMLFPLEVFDAVRSEWPQDRLLGVRLLCTDWTRRGFEPDDAVLVARELVSRGCDLIEVAAGGSSPRAEPEYRRLYLAPLADRVRNEARVPVIVGGNIAKPDDANTILAAGRADLCLIDARIYAS